MARLVARYTATPGVINLTVADARARSAAAGLTFEGRQAGYSETVAKGSVISTDPGAGSRILKDGTVSAVISHGPERYAVPDVRGKSLEDAAQAITDPGLAVRRGARRSARRCPRARHRHRPRRAARTLRPGTTVDLVVSRGPRPIKVPDWTGKDADRAETALQRQGFEVEPARPGSDDVGPRARSSPRARARAPRFKAATRSAGGLQGPVLVAGPEGDRHGRRGRHRALEAAGFDGRREHTASTSGSAAWSGVDPGAGDLAPAAAR